MQAKFLCTVCIRSFTFFTHMGEKNGISAVRHPDAPIAVVGQCTLGAFRALHTTAGSQEEPTRPSTRAS
jgi:hypothetical protein